MKFPIIIPFSRSVNSSPTFLHDSSNSYICIAVQEVLSAFYIALLQQFYAKIARIIFEKLALKELRKEFQISRFYDWLTRRHEILNSVKDMRVDKISRRIQKKAKVSFSSYESSFRKKYIYRVIAFSIESWPISTIKWYSYSRYNEIFYPIHEKQKRNPRCIHITKHIMDL